MPRRSKRITYIKKLETRVKKLKKAYIISLGDQNDNVYKTDNYLYLMYMLAYRKLKHATSKRYLFRKKKYRKHTDKCVYESDFNKEGDPPWLNDSEFLSSYRMTRKTMEKLIDMDAVDIN